MDNGGIGAGCGIGDRRGGLYGHEKMTYIPRLVNQRYEHSASPGLSGLKESSRHTLFAIE